jgi:hypothetical protein
VTIEHCYRLDLASGSLGARRRTPQGGLIVDANLTKTGVFPYRMPDGSTRHELRSPEEVFHPDSMATYQNAPVTVDHPGRVGPANWKTHAVGTVGAPARQNGNYLSSELHLQHGDAMERAESGALHDVSCGYTCDFVPVPGVYQGQPHDGSQTKIRINHVAVGPKGWGRMGTDTRMHLDAAEAISGEDRTADGLLDDGGHYLRGVASENSNPGEPMSPEEKAALDRAEKAAKDAGDALAKARADAADAKTEGDKLAAQTRADQAELVELRAKNKVLAIQVERDRNDGKSADEQREREAQIARDVEELIGLRADARMVFATPEDVEGKKWKADGKSADGIRLEVLTHLEPTVRMDSDLASLDATNRSRVLKSVYDHVITAKRRTDKARADAMEAAAGPRAEEGDDEEGDDGEPPVDASTARKAMVKRKKDGWKAKRDGAKK